MQTKRRFRGVSGVHLSRHSYLLFLLQRLWRPCSEVSFLLFFLSLAIFSFFWCFFFFVLFFLQRLWRPCSVAPFFWGGGCSSPSCLIFFYMFFIVIICGQLLTDTHCSRAPPAHSLICMYICVYIYMYISIYLYIHIYMYICANALVVRGFTACL